jgi:TrmH family RNA methyltransferase
MSPYLKPEGNNLSAVITSSTNSKIKLVRSLQTRKRNREKESAFVVEGVRLVDEAINSNWGIKFILYDESLSGRGMDIILDLQDHRQIDTAQIAPQLMSEISDTETSQGILAVLELQTLPLPPSPTFVVIGDQIRDPGNMGTLLRTAEAAGADAFLNSPGTVDAFSPKVLRGGMGAHFYLPIHHLGWDKIAEVVEELPIYLADAENGVPLWEADFQQPCAILIGGEAFGASAEGKTIATHKVTIPMRGRAESLNAAIAGGILIAEVLRQRHQSQKEKP